MNPSPVIVHCRRWRIEAGPLATAACHEALPIGAGCDCAPCRNRLAAVPRSLTAGFRALAEQLALDVRRPVELCHYGLAPDQWW